MWMYKTEIKQLLKNNLNLFFEKHNYKYSSKLRGGGGTVGFISKTKNPMSYVSYYVYENGTIEFIPISLIFEEVEKILFEVRLPNISVKHHYEKPFGLAPY